MTCPWLDAVAAGDKDTLAALESEFSPDLLAHAAERLASLTKHPTDAAHLDTSNPDHPVIRPDPPPGTSDDDPTSAGAPVDDRRDTNI